MKHGVAASLLVLLAACGGPPPPSGDTVIHPYTTVIGGDETTTTSTFEVDGDTVIFSDPRDAADIEVGDVLVSAEGTGLLRRATAIRTVDGRVEVDTAEAVLTDAVESGSLGTTLSLGQSPDGQSLGVQTGELRPQAFEPITHPLARVLYEGTIENPDLGSAVVLLEISEGAITFTPDIALGLVIRDSAIDTFSVVTSGELKLDAKLHFNASGAAALEDSVLLSPAGKDHLYRKVFTQWIGYVPVVEVVTVDLEVGYQAGANADVDVTTSAGATAALSIGAEYSDREWTEVSSNTFTTRYEAPVTTARIQGFGYVWAKPIITVELYGIAGPELSVEGGPRLDIDSASDPWWTLKALLSSTGQFNVGVLDYDLSSPEFTLFEREWLLASANEGVDPGGVSVSVTPTSATLPPGGSESFVAVVENAADDSVTWDATCGTLDAAGLTASYTAPSTERSCTITVTSVEDATATASALVTAQEPNELPSITSFMALPDTITEGESTTLSWTVSDPDGDTVACTLDVDGDGTFEHSFNDCAATSEKVHTYDVDGTYTATLSASDGRGGTDVASATVTVQSSSTPTGTSFTTIAAGYWHSLALDQDGNAWSWGRDYFGQLGDSGTNTDTGTPVQVAMPSGITFTTIAAGYRHSLALDQDGNAWAWGADSYGQLGDSGTNTDMNTPVRVAMPSGITFSTIAAGYWHSLALDQDGNAWSWGRDLADQLGDGGTNTDMNTPVQVAMPNGIAFSTIVGGSNHSLALDQYGNAWSWGYNGDGQLGDGGTNTDTGTPVQVAMPSGITFTTIAAGYRHSLALDQDGNAWAWGADSYGQLGDSGTNTDMNTPVRVAMPSGTSFTTTGAGRYHSLAVDYDGNAWGWGRDEYGQRGDGGSNTDTDRPVQVSMPSAITFTTIEGGWAHSLTLDRNGDAWSWGVDDYGQLGDSGTNTDMNRPVRVAMP